MAKLTETLRSGEVDTIFSWGLDLRQNEIYLEGVDRGYEVDEGQDTGTDQEMLKTFKRNVGLCQSRNPGRPILIHTTNIGGLVGYGFGIHDYIKAASSEGTYITMLGAAHIESMGSVIFQAADWRVLMPHTDVMLHFGSGPPSGNSDQRSRSINKFHERTHRPRMLKIYSERMQEKGKMKDKSRNEIEEWLTEEIDKKHDLYFTSEEAVEMGLADEVFQGWKNYLDMRNRKPKIPNTDKKSRRRK